MKLVIGDGSEYTISAFSYHNDAENTSSQINQNYRIDIPVATALTDQISDIEAKFTEENLQNCTMTLDDGMELTLSFSSVVLIACQLVKGENVFYVLVK